MMRRKNNKRRKALAQGLRSGYEKDVLENHPQLRSRYETTKIYYTLKKTYTPDLTLAKKNGDPMHIEMKGRWTSSDRTKIRTCRADGHDIRVLFQRGGAKLNKSSKTTYMEYCNKYGIPCAEGTTIPKQWLDECID